MAQCAVSRGVVAPGALEGFDGFVESLFAVGGRLGRRHCEAAWLLTEQAHDLSSARP